MSEGWRFRGTHSLRADCPGRRCRRSSRARSPGRRAASTGRTAPPRCSARTRCTRQTPYHLKHQQRKIFANVHWQEVVLSDLSAGSFPESCQNLYTVSTVTAQTKYALLLLQVLGSRSDSFTSGSSVTNHAAILFLERGRFLLQPSK